MVTFLVIKVCREQTSFDAIYDQNPTVIKKFRNCPSLGSLTSRTRKEVEKKALSSHTWTAGPIVVIEASRTNADGSQTERRQKGKHAKDGESPNFNVIYHEDLSLFSYVLCSFVRDIISSDVGRPSVEALRSEASKPSRYRS